VTGRDEIKRMWSNPISLHRGQYQWKEWRIDVSTNIRQNRCL